MIDISLHFFLFIVKYQSLAELMSKRDLNISPIYVFSVKFNIMESMSFCSGIDTLVFCNSRFKYSCVVCSLR